MSEELRIPQSKADKPSALRTTLIYVVLIAVFIYVYQLAATKSLPSVGALSGAFVGFLVLLFVVYFFVNARQIRQFMSDNNQAISKIARGEHQSAQKLLWAWAERTQIKAVNAVARHNLGWTLMRQGKLQQCVDVLTDNDSNFESGLKSTAMYPTSALDMALAHALLGNVADAEQWMAKADERSNGRNMPTFPGMQAFSRAVIDCRAGRTADASRLLDDKWAECEQLLTGENLRPMRVIRAFAHAAAGPRNAGVVEQVLASMRPAYAAEFDFLGAAWPEMQTFLAAHNLAS